MFCCYFKHLLQVKCDISINASLNISHSPIYIIKVVEFLLSIFKLGTSICGLRKFWCCVTSLGGDYLIHYLFNQFHFLDSLMNFFKKKIFQKHITCNTRKSAFVFYFINHLLQLVTCQRLYKIQFSYLWNYMLHFKYLVSIENIETLKCFRYSLNIVYIEISFYIFLILL